AMVLLVTPSLTLPRFFAVWAQEPTGRDQEPPAKTSFDQVAPALLGQVTFPDMMAKDKADKPSVMARQEELLAAPYHLASRPDPNVHMSRGKPIQVGPAARLPEGMTWERLAEMSPDDVREKGSFPKGFLPLPHPKHDAGGMLFPQMEIKL